MDTSLIWLPERADWSDLLAAANAAPPAKALLRFQELANTRMDFVRASRLDKAIQRYLSAHGATDVFPSLRLGMLASSNVSGLLPAIRIGAFRRGLLVEIYEGPYGMYRQELADATSGLHAFRPDVVCFALDAQHVAGAAGASAESAVSDVRSLWKDAKGRLGCSVIQQTLLPRLPRVMGNNEERMPQSPAAIVARFNDLLRGVSAEDGVNLLALDVFARDAGISQWFDPSLWFSSKQEVHPRAWGMYGDQLGRMLAAMRGRSAKCLVLDLDNTLWGGVIGDDGMDGIVLGQGTAAGEAHLALQQYARALSERGIILAVCSKNDESNAFAGFDQHPEMLLKRTDIACFVANWRDKAANLRDIAARLNIGLDSLVFVDDNPAERALIRRELPMVAVPELPDDPAEYVHCIAAAGYFEALDMTAEDRERAGQYRANAARETLMQSATDMDSYLHALNMQLQWSTFEPASLKRVVQLVNKTNQFNLTTRRYTEEEISSFAAHPAYVTLLIRLSDVYGDNGIISIVIGKETEHRAILLDTWLMSCRVLGRRVEEATLNLVADAAMRRGCTRLIGEYRPTAKNSMVRDHYRKLGFEPLPDAGDGAKRWALDLSAFQPRSTPMEVLPTSEPATAVN